MKLSLIREATINQVQKRIPIWTQKHFGNDEQKALAQIPDIIAADPTKGKYSEWLVKQWKDGTARFPEDTEKLTKNLQLFHQKKSKLQEKDISRYTPSSLAKTLGQELGLTKSERKSARKGGLQLPPGAEVVVEDERYTAVKITTPEASSILSSGTEWCVANKDVAQDYLSQGPLYLIYIDTQFDFRYSGVGEPVVVINKRMEGDKFEPDKELKRKYLVHFEEEQFMDVYDSPVNYKTELELIELLEPATGKSIYNDGLLALAHARHIGGRFPEGEAAIAKMAMHLSTSAADEDLSYGPISYAKNVIKGRWLEAEETLAKHPGTAYNYALDIIKGRWPEGEAAIAKDPEYACYYAGHVIKGRFPEAEVAIAKDPENAYYYAKNVIKGRFPEAESTIAKDPENAYLYAMDIIKGRWPEGEAAIAQNNRYSPIFRNSQWNDYAEHYINDSPPSPGGGGPGRPRN